MAAFEILKKFKMAAATMVTKVQKMLNSLQTGDPFETWHKNRTSLKVVLFVFKIFKMAANIKILKIVKNSKNRFQWKWIFTGSKTCCSILQPFYKIQKSSDLGKIWFPSSLWWCESISIVWKPCYDPSDHIISCWTLCFLLIFIVYCWWTLFVNNFVRFG